MRAQGRRAPGDDPRRRAQGKAGAVDSPVQSLDAARRRTPERVGTVTSTWTPLLGRDDALIPVYRPAEAVAAGRIALTNLLPEGDGCQLLAALALLAALQGRLAAAARIIGRDDAIAARTEEVLRPVSVLLRAYIEPLLAGPGADELARLRAEGAAMRDGRVFNGRFGTRRKAGWDSAS